MTSNKPKKEKEKQRRFAKLFLDIWEDPDFQALNVDAQHLFFMFLSSKQRTNAGVLPYTPGRFTRNAADLDRAVFDDAVTALEEARFIVVDRESQEILIRSFVRNDEGIKQPNMATNIGRTIGSIFSEEILDALFTELARYMATSPELQGWESLRNEVTPGQWQAISTRAQRIQQTGEIDPDEGERGPENLLEHEQEMSATVAY